MRVGYETGNIPFYLRFGYEPYYKGHQYVLIMFNGQNILHDNFILFTTYQKYIKFLASLKSLFF
jgi:hypothetical protein